MPFSVWMGVKFAPGGHSTFFALLNTFVHIVMYFYYMVAAMGPQFQKYIWWKKYLTTMQMVSSMLSRVITNLEVTIVYYTILYDIVLFANSVLFVIFRILSTIDYFILLLYLYLLFLKYIPLLRDDIVTYFILFERNNRDQKKWF